MSATLRVPDVDQNQAVDQVSIACERIAPSWPLDRWIAVNPWWGHRHQGIEEAAIELVSRRGQGMLMAPEFYLEAWHGGRIQEGDLIAAAPRIVGRGSVTPKTVNGSLMTSPV